MVLAMAIAVFYVLVLCRGSINIMVIILWLFSFFPRRSLVRQLKLSGQRGAKTIDLYFQYDYESCMETGVFAARKTMSLDTFAMESLCSNSSEKQLAGIIVLDSLLQQRDSREELVSRILSYNKAPSTLIGMLGWTDARDGDTRLFAARVTTKLADGLRIAEIPGMVNLVSSLLDANNQPAGHQSSAQTASGNGEGTTVGRSWVCQFWQWMIGKWSIPEEPPLTHLDLFPVLGMAILQKLSCDLDNGAEIIKSKNLVSKIIGLIRYTTGNGSSNDTEQNAVICSSLNVVRQLAITSGKIGAMFRQELQKNPFLLNNVANILEDTRSNPQLWKPAMDIIAKLALDMKTGKEIGRLQLIIGKLMHGRYGPTNMDDDQFLPMVAGEALANLALWGTANCSAILEEPGYEVIQDLKNMLCDDEYRYVAANLLQSICVHCRVKLSHPEASEHLSSVLTTGMEQIEAAEGKQLESIIGLTSEIGNVIRETFVYELESQTSNGLEIVQKLVNTLNSNKVPNPEYPRMRRVIVKMVITILESCHRTVEKMMEEAVMEGLMGRTDQDREDYI